MDAAKAVSEPLHGFMVESVRLVRRCNKPDRKGKFLHVHMYLLFPYDSHKTVKAVCRFWPTLSFLHLLYLSHHTACPEFLKISTATAVGFAVMGLIGFFVRLVHIPVNSILLGMLYAHFYAFLIISNRFFYRFTGSLFLSVWTDTVFHRAFFLPVPFFLPSMFAQFHRLTLSKPPPNVFTHSSALKNKRNKTVSIWNKHSYVFNETFIESAAQQTYLVLWKFHSMWTWSL